MEELRVMAQATIQGLDKAIDELFKDYKKAIKIAAEEATNKAKEDIHQNAVLCLLQYYADYPNPTVYNRTYQLINCFVPFSEPVKEDAGGFICRAGMVYDPDRVANTYSGSEIYTPTDAEWIIDNYLQGIHPRTDGSYTVGGGNYEHEKYQGSFVPSFEMQKYLNGYRYIFDDNFRFALSRQVLKLIKK